jgi:hypothetical protein
MKAISIQQPYAHLIVTPQCDLPRPCIHKRVENRTWWPFQYFGPLLIHASMGRDYLDSGEEEVLPNMVFGAILGQVELIAVRSSAQIAIPDSLVVVYGGERIDLEWVRRHSHTEGPICLILRNAQRFKQPIPYKGRLGLFDIPDSVVAGHELEEVTG